VREEDWERLEELARIEEGDDFDSLFWQGSHPYTARDTVAQAEFEARLATVLDPSGLRGAFAAANALGDQAALSRLSEVGRSAGWSESVRATASMWSGYAVLAGGRWEMADGGRCPTIRAPEGMGGVMCALIPFLPVPDDALRALRAAVAAWDSVPAADGERADSIASADPDAALRPHGRLYVLGAIDARLGDAQAALGAADRLETLPTPSRWRPTVRALARTLRAEVALRAGRAEEALALLAVPADAPPPELANHPVFARELERLWRADALYEAGRNEEALRWYRNAFAYTFDEEIYRPYITLRRAELLDRLGRPEEAAAEYSRFLELWPDPAPDLHPLVEDARQRLATLRSERT
jgi:tetratricopeptide (TPR) repeat protein